MPKQVCISTFSISSFVPNQVRASSGIYSSAILPICGGGKPIKREIQNEQHLVSTCFILTMDPTSTQFVIGNPF
jgi:hypothetical protein